jgi:hypothetical protein
MNIHRRMHWLLGMLGFIAACGTAMGQPADVPPSMKPACPPDVKADGAPTVGSAAPDLSEKLAQSKGIICPPAAVDPEMAVPPPASGKLKVIPPPGSPGGDSAVQPK